MELLVRRSRTRLSWAGFALLAAALRWSAPATAGPDGTAPAGPVVIYLVDTLRQDRVSAYGAPRPTTPAADALAREGVLFENAYALSSWTRASVGTLFTSVLPAESGAFDRNGKLRESLVSLPALFQSHGWKTAAFVGNANIDPTTGFGRGFDSFAAIDSANPAWSGHPSAREVVEPALRFIDAQSSSKFFLYVHVLDPHALDPRLDHPLEPESRSLFAAKGRAAGGEREALLLEYDRAVRQADDQFARIVAALRAKGFWAGATVVYTSDHGEEFLEHGARLHGFSLYEEQIRIPLILKTPAFHHPPLRRREIVSLADLTPTLSALFDLGSNPRWIGVNLLLPVPARPTYYTEDLDKCRLYALRRGTQKIIVRLNPNFDVSIFDLDRDPGERNGRALGCGSPDDLDASTLVDLSRQWRARELPFFPGVHFEKLDPEAMRVFLTANLAETTEPFLTPETHCQLSPLLRGSVLSFGRNLGRGEIFDVVLAASDQQELPTFRLVVFDAAGSPLVASATSRTFRVFKVAMPTASEPDEQIQKLRNLGYLGGRASPGGHSH